MDWLELPSFAVTRLQPRYCSGRLMPSSRQPAGHACRILSRRHVFGSRSPLPFPLLSDQDHAVADAYGAWGERSMYGRKFMGIVRSAFLVDEQGNLAEVWPKISPKDTPTKLLAALEG